jgi:phage terminase small subunit
VIPLKEELTAKQEKFIQNIVSGMSQRQAYKDAYNAENMTDKSIDEEACRLFNDVKISTRYKSIMKKLEDEAIMTARERMIWLSDVVKGKVKHTSYGSNGEAYENEAYISDKLRAVDTLNKMSGEYITKVEADVSSEMIINIELSDD